MPAKAWWMRSACRTHGEAVPECLDTLSANLPIAVEDGPHSPWQRFPEKILLLQLQSQSDRKSTRLNSSHSLHDALPIYIVLRPFSCFNCGRVCRPKLGGCDLPVVRTEKLFLSVSIRFRQIFPSLWKMARTRPGKDFLKRFCYCSFGHN